MLLCCFFVLLQKYQYILYIHVHVKTYKTTPKSSNIKNTLFKKGNLSLNPTRPTKTAPYLSVDLARDLCPDGQAAGSFAQCLVLLVAARFRHFVGPDGSSDADVQYSTLVSAVEATLSPVSGAL